MTYYIYHIPGVKIGCTDKPKKRIQYRQRYTEWEILEEHTDIYEASNREQELQKEYGYVVDTIPYWKSIENSGFSKGHNYGRSDFGVDASKGGVTSSSETRQCPYCATVMKQPIVYRWHFDNCKHKKR